MKIPTKIRIGNKEYKVRERRYLFNNEIGGQINYNKNTLDIRRFTSEIDKEVNFFHELAHGILRELELNHPKTTTFRSDEDFVHEMGLIMRKSFLDLMKTQKCDFDEEDKEVKE